MGEHELSFLQKQNCNSEYGGSECLSSKEMDNLLSKLKGWEIIIENNLCKLRCTFYCGNFSESMSLANEIAEISDDQNHHPSMMVEWGKVTVTWWTHELSGLHLNDFIMAAKCSLIATTSTRQ
ncbi:MAG: hypothetical protein CBC09_01380 [Cellvibrionales bacterium TMED49]|nr:4a-hydroxytetrahydrobiopterin dehydratase [Porticoccaceae bacterium]OUU39845.1 MAG: hypothetical protein CBC09_01380 [Cellvibrionales bacterium TMED49]